MRIRTSLSIFVLVGSGVAIPLYLVVRPDPAAETPAPESAAELPAAADVDARDVYCLRPTPENGVLVNTGSRCSNRPESTGAHSPTVTVTSEQDALVITGSDP